MALLLCKEEETAIKKKTDGGYPSSATSRVVQHIVENHKAGMSKAGNGLMKISGQCFAKACRGPS